MGKDFLNITDSSKWIDYRNLDFKDVMLNIISGYDWKEDEKNDHISSNGRRIDKDFLFDYKSLSRFENVEAERNKNYLCNFINAGIRKYIKLTLNKENTYSSEMTKWINEYQSIAENTNDELFYESLESDDFFILGETNQYRPKLSGEEDHESMLKAYKKRNEFIRGLVNNKDKNALSEDQIKVITNAFETETNAYFYLGLQDFDFEEFSKICEKRYSDIRDKVDVIFRTKSKDNSEELRKIGTKLIPSKGEYEKSKSFSDLKKSASKLKELHTDVVGRAIMDMAGIYSPLYVKRDGKPYQTNTGQLHGYCTSNRATGEVYEIGVIDYPDDRAQSYKTTVHETMHGLLSKTIKENGMSYVFDLPSRYNEGIVELVASTSLKEAYGKEYKNKDRRSYEDYVVDTVLKLKRMPEYKDKTISQLGQILGDAAFNGDAKTLEKIKDHLVNTRISYKQVNSFTPEQIEKAAKNRYAAEHDGDMTNFEKTQLAMLVERIKNTNYTLEDAMRGGQRYLAFVLLYNILDEEDDETLGLL